MKKTSYLILIAWIVLFIIIGPKILMGSFINKYPTGYGASDAFQHSERAVWIKEHGYKYEAPYMSGGHEDVIGFYPPLFYYGVIALSWVIPIWDAAIWLPFICMLISGILMFFIIKKYDEDLAILSVPIFFFVMHWGVFFGFSWGHWPAYMGQMFFMIMLTSLFMEKQILKSILLYASFVGMILSHTPAAVFGGIIFGLYVIYSFVKNKDWKIILDVALVGVAFLTCLGYLLIFVNTWLRVQGPEVVSGWGNPLFSVASFGIFFGYVLIPLGIAFLVYHTYQKEKNVHILWFVLLAALLGFGNYFFLSWRAFQFRFLWPLLFAPIIALPWLWAFKELSKRFNKTAMSAALVVFVLVLSVGIGSSQQFIKEPNRLMMPYELWQTFQVIRELPEGSDIYYFDSPMTLSQASVLFVGQKVHSRLDQTQFLNYYYGRINITNVLPSRVGGDVATKFPHLVGGKFEFYAEDNPDGMMDVCDFDYFVFDIYSFEFAKMMVEKNNPLVFTTENYLVLKNGGVKPCI